MTEALRKMVEAMVTEFRRQHSDDLLMVVNYVEHASPNETVLDGRFDLDKVARAGLRAIHDPGNEAVFAGAAARASSESVTGTWAAMVREILTEQP